MIVNHIDVFTAEARGRRGSFKISSAAKNAKSAKKSFIMVFKFCAFLRALRQKNIFSLRLD